MPEYIYRAITSKGQIVRNRVEDVNKNTLIKKLKNNDLLPISIVQVGYRSKKTKVNRRNMMDIDDIMKQADSANIMQGRTSAKPSIKERVNLALSREEKITSRDLIIFTQDFYLLSDLVTFQVNYLLLKVYQYLYLIVLSVQIQLKCFV